MRSDTCKRCWHKAWHHVLLGCVEGCKCSLIHFIKAAQCTKCGGEAGRVEECKACDGRGLV